MRVFTVRGVAYAKSGRVLSENSARRVVAARERVHAGKQRRQAVPLRAYARGAKLKMKSSSGEDKNLFLAAIMSRGRLSKDTIHAVTASLSTQNKSAPIRSSMS